MENKQQAQIEAIFMILNAVISSLPAGVAAQAGRKLAQALDQQELAEVNASPSLQPSMRRHALVQHALALLSDSRDGA
jgi:hypothetical protein